MQHNKALIGDTDMDFLTELFAVSATPMPKGYFDTFVFVIELISVMAFGISGSLTAIRKGMDVFGVVIIGITTAIGGGIIRDVILGVHPPLTFANPIYAAVTAGVSLTTFIINYRQSKHRAKDQTPKAVRVTDLVMFWLDTIGISIFTVVGVSAAYTAGTVKVNLFLLCFVGVITGVGGGIMRDLLTGNTPYVFVKHFYASACLCGALVCSLLWTPAGRITSMLCGAVTIAILRALAAHYRWNLPRIPAVSDSEKPNE